MITFDYIWLRLQTIHIWLITLDYIWLCFYKLFMFDWSLYMTMLLKNIHIWLIALYYIWLRYYKLSISNWSLWLTHDYVITNHWSLWTIYMTMLLQILHIWLITLDYIYDYAITNSPHLIDHFKTIYDFTTINYLCSIDYFGLYMTMLL